MWSSIDSHRSIIRVRLLYFGALSFEILIEVTWASPRLGNKLQLWLWHIPKPKSQAVCS